MLVTICHEKQRWQRKSFSIATVPKKVVSILSHFLQRSWLFLLIAYIFQKLILMKTNAYVHDTGQCPVVLSLPANVVGNIYTPDSLVIEDEANATFFINGKPVLDRLRLDEYARLTAARVAAWHINTRNGTLNSDLASAAYSFNQCNVSIPQILAVSRQKSLANDILDLNYTANLMMMRLLNILQVSPEAGAIPETCAENSKQCVNGFHLVDVSSYDNVAVSMESSIFDVCTEIMEGLEVTNTSRSFLSSENNFFERKPIANTEREGNGHNASCLPCAIFDPSTSAVNQRAPRYFDVPYLSLGAIDTSMNEDIIEHIVLMYPGPEYSANVLMQYLADMKRSYVAVLHESSDDSRGIYFWIGIKKSSNLYGLHTERFPFAIEPEDDTLTHLIIAMKELRETGFCTILVVVDVSRVELVSKAAQFLSMNSTDFLWIFCFPDPIEEGSTLYFTESSTRTFFQGTGIFSLYVPQRRSQLANIIREFDFGKGNSQSVESNYFTNPYMVYDAIVTNALSACDARNNETLRRSKEQFKPIQTVGVSGDITFDDNVNRNIHTYFFQIINLQPDPYNEKHLRLVRTKYWEDMHWLTENQFIYKDSTSSPPPLRLVDVNMHLISKPERIFSWILGSVCIVASIASMIYIRIFRNHELIKLTRPDYLYLLCTSSLVSSIYCFFGVYDENLTSDEKFLTLTCYVRLYAVVTGAFIGFAAFMAKVSYEFQNI